MRPNYLFHVTRRSALPNIAKRGLETSHAPTEVTAGREGAGLTPEPEEYEDDGGGERPCAEVAREELDEFVEEARPRDAAFGKQSPPHHEGVFLWASKAEATKTASAVQSRDKLKQVILKIDPAKVPCRCWTAPYKPLEDIFDTLFSDCAAPKFRSEEEDEAIAKDVGEWWKHAAPYKGKEESGVEVWCPCDIPTRAIVEVQSPGGKAVHQRRELGTLAGLQKALGKP